MRWQRSKDWFDFTIQDIETLSIKTAKNNPLMTPEVHFRIDHNGNYLDTKNAKEVAKQVIDRLRVHQRTARPNIAEETDAKVWKEKIKLLQKSLIDNTENVWDSMIGGWLEKTRSAGDPDETDASNMLRQIKEVIHSEKLCLSISTGEMSDSDHMRSHISRKVLDKQTYESTLKKTDNYIPDPLCAWGMKGESLKVRKLREKYNRALSQGQDEEFLESENLKDVIGFQALDKFDLGSLIVEAQTGRPHLVKRDKATRIAFETYDGTYIQLEQEVDLHVFLWDKKKREEYFYKEATSFMQSSQELFRTVMLKLMRMKGNPLKFSPKEPIGNKVASTPQV